LTPSQFKKVALLEDMKFGDPILQSLYFIKQDKWEEAHNIAQDIESKYGYLVHGLLHRIEGDNWNASYWYMQAGEADFKGSLEEEWDYILNFYLRL